MAIFCVFICLLSVYFLCIYVYLLSNCCVFLCILCIIMYIYVYFCIFLCIFLCIFCVFLYIFCVFSVYFLCISCILSLYLSIFSVYFLCIFCVFSVYLCVFSVYLCVFSLYLQPNTDHHEVLSGQHNWYACSHARPTYCNVCKEALSGVTSHGLSCEGMTSFLKLNGI